MEKKKKKQIENTKQKTKKKQIENTKQKKVTTFEYRTRIDRIEVYYIHHWTIHASTLTMRLNYILYTISQ